MKTRRLSGDTVGNMAEPDDIARIVEKDFEKDYRRVHACLDSEVERLDGARMPSRKEKGKTRMVYYDFHLWVPTPEGCLLVWENEESNVEWKLEEVESI